MSSIKLWRSFTNLIVEKTLTIGVGGRIIVKNPDGTSAALDNSSQILTTTRQVLAEESGKTFYLGSTTAFVTTLPAPSLGLKFTFILKSVPASDAHTVVTAASANIIQGKQSSVAGDAGDTGATDDTISFVTAQTVAGDKVELFCDGTKWYAHAISSVAAGITFTTAS